MVMHTDTALGMDTACTHPDTRGEHMIVGQCVIGAYVSVSPN